MTNKQAIFLAHHYETLDTMLSGMAETEHGTADALAGCEDHDALSLVLPSLAAARRRLLTLAAAMQRVQKTIGGDDSESHVRT